MDMDMDKKLRFGRLAFLLAFALAFWFVQRGSTLNYPQLPYSEFSKRLGAEQVELVEIRPNALLATLKEPVDGKRKFLTERVDLSLARELDQRGVQYFAVADQPMWPVWLLLIALPLGLGLLLRMLWGERRPLGNFASGLEVGKSKARVYAETDTKVTFRDVAGVDEAKRELQEIVAFLRDPQKYGRLGARMPRGVLLVGPPGTGKTLLARAVAGEAGVPFFSINGSEFVEMFVGVGAARVRDLFEQARKRAPSIIFIDELDALGRARNAAPYIGGHDEKEQTLNQLLSELDGFDASAGLVLLAATNRPEILDAALLRAGRFDRQVLVDRPDRAGRIQILEVHVRKLKCAPTLSLDQVAAMTPGFTGADLANLCNEAALTATRRGANDIELNDFVVAVERIVAGLEKKNRLLNSLERNVVAYHEVGHALVGSLLARAERIQKVSIIPRGIGALGYTLQRPIEDRYLMTREELDSKLAVLMGGRAAEALVHGQFSTGAADDLAKATELAHSMATRYGMVPELGHMAFDLEPASMLGPANGARYAHAYSDQSAHEVESAVKKILEQAFHTATLVLSRNRALLENAATQLLACETLTEHQVQQLFADAVLPDASPSQERNGRSPANRPTSSYGSHG
jgi:cell division protease FtsH